ncbi:hypothetical protein C0995_008396 [Termitomyces sp. Mi166|nr:hypothetical protein C0995_008396 [Termitomyces sp. Mi166\
MASAFLDQYETLDVIGNGSFGIIRKVRRKTDGLYEQIFARKELNFERMNERDRKQIVAEVNILKDLGHDHIVRYHDRFVDREAGILYILMEYCGGGDLSTVIKQAARTNRPISEDKIWSYLLQILLALNYCHHPNGHARTSSGGNNVYDNAGTSARAQILHRDLKPDNVFLDTTDKVKLGDFGLSRALTQTNFANTYVGTPYYMSPELMQEKAYDTKSDIWSLGCVIYELCALKPPFYEAKTHQELSNFIRAGRIPPLPRGYSQTLASLIKSMLNLNPAMRPSAAQLLQHERVSLTLKVIEAEKILNSVKSHRSDNAARERDLNVRESMLREREQQMATLVGQKDTEIANLQRMVAALQERGQYSQQQMEAGIEEAVAHREEELRVLVMKREKEVADAMARREEEIMEAVRRREGEGCEAWAARETEIRKEFEDGVKAVEERIEWIQAKEEELKAEEARLEAARAELEERVAKWEENLPKGRKDKMPLEEIKNIPTRHADNIPQQRRKQDNPTPRPTQRTFPSLATPIMRPYRLDSLPSAMKGVVLTSTGEVLATPTPAEVANLFQNSPKVGLNFTKIFDFEDGDEEDESSQAASSATNGGVNLPPSPSSRKEKERVKTKVRQRGTSSDAESAVSSSTNSGGNTSNAPTRLRRPSIRSRSQAQRTKTLPSSASDPSGLSSASGPASTSQNALKSLRNPHLPNTTGRMTVTKQQPDYDLVDEENLPSPFLKRNLDRPATRPPVQQVKKRPSAGHGLRAVAVANAASKRVSASLSSEDTRTESSDATTRPALASARKAGEEARKTLSRS